MRAQTNECTFTDKSRALLLRAREEGAVDAAARYTFSMFSAAMKHPIVVCIFRSLSGGGGAPPPARRSIFARSRSRRRRRMNESALINGRRATLAHNRSLQTRAGKKHACSDSSEIEMSPKNVADHPQTRKQANAPDISWIQRTKPES